VRCHGLRTPTARAAVHASAPLGSSREAGFGGGGGNGDDGDALLTATARLPPPFPPPAPQVLAAIGEQFAEGEELCGLAVNIRPAKDRVELWTRTAANEAVQTSLGKQFKQTLDLGDSSRLGYVVFVGGPPPCACWIPRCRAAAASPSSGRSGGGGVAAVCTIAPQDLLGGPCV
jgi:hypothetical protein